MSDVVYKSATEIVDEAWARLITQFQDADTLRGYIGGLLEPSADVEDTVSAIRDGMDVDNATGDQLDKLGELVGESRQGRADALYRLYIKARILVNTSYGRAQDVIALFQQLAPTLTAWTSSLDVSVQLTEYYPASFDVTLYGVGVSTDELVGLQTFLGDTRGAGVDARIIYQVDNDDAFRFAGDGVTDVDNGFGNGEWLGVATT
jgi:hypothetical protein